MKHWHKEDKVVVKRRKTEIQTTVRKETEDSVGDYLDNAGYRVKKQQSKQIHTHEVHAFDDILDT